MRLLNVKLMTLFLIHGYNYKAEGKRSDAFIPPFSIDISVN